MKKGIVLILALIMILSLAACGSSKSSIEESGGIVGVWNGSWEYEGNNYNESVEFMRDGTYDCIRYENNKKIRTEKGTYTVDGSKVVLKDNSGGKRTWEYRNGTLKSNIATYVKE